MTENGDPSTLRLNRRRMLAYGGSGVAAVGLGTGLVPAAGAATAAERKRLARAGRRAPCRGVS
jgi:hypothetical protein